MNVAMRRHGLTVLEVVVIVVVVFIVIVALLPVIGGGHGHAHTRTLKDSTQVRGIVQAMTIWAGNHNDDFPLPSIIDRENATVPEIGTAKDTTANILSILLNEGLVSPELLICPAEASENVQQCMNYEFNSPHAAVDPSKALWDPAFSADFTNGKAANNSYAQAYPPRSDGGRGKWESVSSTSATDAVFGNRGPQVSSVTYSKYGAASPVFTLGTNSITNLIHGGRKTWEGNIAFADGHVDFLTSVIAGKYTTDNGMNREDVLFSDESDAKDGKNNFLGIFIKAGDSRSDFVSIWD